MFGEKSFTVSTWFELFRWTVSLKISTREQGPTESFKTWDPESESNMRNMIQVPTSNLNKVVIRVRAVPFQGDSILRLTSEGNYHVKLTQTKIVKKPDRESRMLFFLFIRSLRIVWKFSPLKASNTIKKPKISTFQGLFQELLLGHYIGVSSPPPPQWNTERLTNFFLNRNRCLKDKPMRWVDRFLLRDGKDSQIFFNCS